MAKVKDEDKGVDQGAKTEDEKINFALALCDSWLGAKSPIADSYWCVQNPQAGSTVRIVPPFS